MSVSGTAFLFKPDHLSDMRQPSCFLLILLCVSCNGRETLDKAFMRPGKTRQALIQKKVPDSLDPERFSKNLLSITGDFNGDGIPEQLTEYYFDTLTNKTIDSVIYDELWPWSSEYRTETWLISSDKKITPLKVPGNDNLGLSSLLNLGDSNADSLDEIALVINHTDFSNMNACLIFQYCNNVWKRVYSFSIHEGCFIHTEDYDVSLFEKSIPDHLEKLENTWYYYDYANTEEMIDENGAPAMRPLDIKKRCLCPSDTITNHSTSPTFFP